MTHPAIEALEVSKQYPGTLALDDVSFRIEAGTVAALIGENGAGKSTLVRILGGIERPTAGRLLVNGVETTLDSVRDADARGIAIIHQELNLCPNLSVAENIFLGREKTRHGKVDRTRQNQRTQELLTLLEQPVDSSTLVGDLPLGMQQIVEIAKALARDVKVLMMDEPTSALSAAEIAVLFRIIGDLKARGVAIVYISHRLEELLEIADTVSVLRDGRMVAQAPARDVDTRWIVERMTGRTEGAFESAAPANAGAVLLDIESVTLLSATGRALLRDVSFSVHAGEVVGLYGLLGAGRTELLECVMGLHPEMTGEVRLNSRPLRRMAVDGRIREGLAMLPEDRQSSGLVPPMSVRANMTLACVGRFVRGVWISRAAEQREAAAIGDELRIKYPGLEFNIGSLSGGNQQKVLLARCLLTNPRVLLLDEPTRGVDVGAKREIHAIVRRLAERGMGILVASSELEEVRALAHRVVVLSRGKVTGIFAAAEANDAVLASAASAGGRDLSGEAA
jgi:erythritol transport system ATP-binding protein